MGHVAAAGSDAGAATFGSGVSGISGVVSPANSLHGSSTDDAVGGTVTALTNGNYVVVSSQWDDFNGDTTNVGAATFGNGVNGIRGAVSSTNSLIGSAVNDQIGNVGVAPLVNGNYVVNSPYWDNDTASNAGAATFGSGANGVIGIAVLTTAWLASRQMTASVRKQLR